jgi:cytochrome c oxidase cbb3-type subunit 4
MDYHLLREFADSWVLLAMVVFFVLVVVWAFRPGSSRTYKDIADIPFRHEDKPAGDRENPGAHVKEARQ